LSDVKYWKTAIAATMRIIGTSPTSSAQKSTTAKTT
jgi:hypothetical protein